MRKTLLSLALFAALALAGCSGDDEHTPDAVTCPDGTILAGEQIEELEGHHDASFNATAQCPVKPSVTLTGIPANLTAFQKAAFRWSLDNGSVHHAHSMLTSIRYGDSSVPDRDLTAVTKYPTELIKREHQDLPVTYVGNLSFAKLGKVYIRAYAEIKGEDYWSPEVVLEITQVPPTGTVVEVTHSPGDVAGSITPDVVDIKLGDAVRLVNDDVVPHSCEPQGGPVAMDTFSADGQGGASDPQVFVVPGSYTFQCNELVQPKSFTVNVAVA